MKTLPGLMFAAILVSASFGSLTHGLTTLRSVALPREPRQPDYGLPFDFLGDNQTVGLPDHCYCKVRGNNTDVMVFDSIAMPYVSNYQCSAECVAKWNIELSQGDFNAGPGQFLCQDLESNGMPTFGPTTVYLYFLVLTQPWVEIKDIKSKQPLSCYDGQYIPSNSLVSHIEHLTNQQSQ